MIAIYEAAYDHDRGVLHKPRKIFPKPKDADHLVKETPLARLAGIDDRAIYDLRVAYRLDGSAAHTLQQNFGYNPGPDQADLATPASMAASVPLPRRPGLEVGTGAVLALERTPDVPPLSLPRSDAERMLTPPRQPATSSSTSERSCSSSISRSRMWCLPTGSM